MQMICKTGPARERYRQQSRQDLNNGKSRRLPRDADIQAMEENKDVRLEHASILKKALPILDKLEKQLSNDHTKLKGTELEVLLKAKGVVSSKQGQGNLANKKDLYQKFITGERVAVNHEPWTWTETDDAKLQALRLRAEPIDLADTAYG